VSRSEDGARPAGVALGIVGMNYWGPNLARNFARIDGCRVAWVCDRDQDVLDRHRSTYPESRFTSRFEDLLEDPGLDAVAIATPVPTHAPLARRALEAGLDAFVEKPLALTADGAYELAALADERNRVLMVDHLLVFHPAVQAVKELIDAGRLGRVFYLYGNRQNLGIVRPDENALWSLGPHDISVMLHLVGERPSEVAASGESYLQPGVEDVVFGRIRFPSGIIGHLHLSWLDPHKMRRMTVIGSERMVVFDDMENERKVTVYDKGPIPRTETYSEYVQVRSGDIHIPKVSATEPLRIVCERFVQAVRDRGPTPSDGRAGAAVVEVLEAMTASLASSGQPVLLAPAEAEAIPPLPAAPHGGGPGPGGGRA
jgi:predicted dehydrogenase